MNPLRDTQGDGFDEILFMPIQNKWQAARSISFIFQEIKNMNTPEWWSEDPYWEDALRSITQAREDGGRYVSIDLKKLKKISSMKMGRRIDFSKQ